MTRSPHRHLDEAEIDAFVLDSALGSLHLSDPQLAEARQHIDSCADCGRKVQMHARAQSEIVSLGAVHVAGKNFDCDPAVNWLQVAGGVGTPAEVRKAMIHAAQCDRCGLLFRDAVNILSDQSSPEEEQILATLKSAQLDWQHELAANLHDRGSVPAKAASRSWPWPTITLIRRRWGWVSALSAMALVAVAAIIWVQRHSDARELALVDSRLVEAYTENRTFDLRIKDAHYGPVRQLRGTDRVVSQMNRPAALLEAEAIIVRQLKSHPDDAEWLQAKGQADLQDGNSEAALGELQRAAQLSPSDGSIKTDLGSAYFLQAEKLNRPIDYGKAVDVLGQVLMRDPNDPVALFNRAIALERIFLFQEAEADWQHFLRVNSAPEWNDEAQSRLRALQQKMREKKNLSSQAPTDPKDYVLNIGSQDEKVRSVLNSRIESYLNEALSSWITQAFEKRKGWYDKARDARAALAALSNALATLHGDRWMNDFLNAGPFDPRFGESFGWLQESHNENSRGNYDHAIALAEKASERYRRIGNIAGYLQARWEHLYATRLSYRAAECFGLARDLWAQIESTPYQWLRARISLDYAQCAELSNKLQIANFYTEVSSRLSEEHDFPDLHLRAIKVDADLALVTTDPAVSFALAIKGLEQFWRSDLDYMPGYNLYSCIDDGAEFEQLWNLDASVIREALQLASEDNDLGMRAVMHQRLADALLASGNVDAADRYLIQTRQSLAAMQQGEAIRAKLAEVEIRLATVEVRRNQMSQAPTRLQMVQDAVNKAGNSDLAFDFYVVLGKSLISSGRPGEAEEAIRKAVWIAENGLRSLRNEHDRLLWSRRSDRAYREMVRLQLSQNPEAGFRWWQWYRGASLRSDSSPRSSGKIDDVRFAASFPVLPDARRTMGNDSLVVSYAMFPDGVAAWVYDGNTTQYQWIAIPEYQIERTRDLFVARCADPDSDLPSTIRLGQELYAFLVGPIEPLLGAHKKVMIEPDRQLDRIPFEALVDGEGRFWGDVLDLSYSPGLFYLALSPEPHPFTSRNRVLAVADPTSHPELNLASLPDAESEARAVASEFADTTLLIGKDATTFSISRSLANAELFHFSGHAVLNANGSALVVGGGPDVLFGLSALARSSLRRLRLVVLSACGSARGPGGGFTDDESLVRTLVSSGVSQVIATRWSIDSSFSRDLMKLFYAHMREGMSCERSLALAARDLRQEKGLKHPFYWAAFAVFGKI